jgi:hypothetical protein
MSLDEIPEYDDSWDVYNPYYERHFAFPDCSGNVALRDIEADEEILCNYLAFDGSLEGDEGVAVLERYRRICAGETVGTVTKYEKAKEASDKVDES